MNRNRFFLVTALLLMSVLILAVPVWAEEYADDFTDPDYSANGWEQSLLFGMPDLDYIFPSRKNLSFHMPDYNTAVYLINSKTNAADTIVEATVENVFSNHAEFGLICRSNEKGWYEFRIQLSGPDAGGYALYRYDKALREEKKNPFVSLHPRVNHYYTEDINLGKKAQNTLRMICEGDEIRIFINGTEQTPLWNSKFEAGEYKEGTSGFSVWTQTPRAMAQVDVTAFRAVFDTN